MAGERNETRGAARAAVWMLGAIVSFSSMAVAGRAVRVELDTFELMLYRSLVGFAIVLAVGGASGALGQVTTRRMGLHLIRNLSHFARQNLWVYAVALIPLAQLFALEFSSPVWVALFAPLLLGERLTRVRALAAATGFAGILIVARPDFSNPSPALFAAAGSAIGFAGSALFTKRLTRTETVLCILFWLTAMQAVFGLVCAGADGVIAWPGATLWPWLVLIGCAGLMAHFCLTRALTLAPAIIVMPMDFLRLPVIAVVGMLFYDEPLQAAVFLGAALIFTANLLNLRAETRPRAPVSAADVAAKRL